MVYETLSRVGLTELHVTRLGPDDAFLQLQDGVLKSCVVHGLSLAVDRENKDVECIRKCPGEWLHSSSSPGRGACPTSALPVARLAQQIVPGNRLVVRGVEQVDASRYVVTRRILHVADQAVAPREPDDGEQKRFANAVGHLPSCLRSTERRRPASRAAHAFLEELAEATLADTRKAYLAELTRVPLLR